MTIELIANKYRVLKSLGQGAMGEVFLVLPPRGEPVALKLLKTLDEEKASHKAIHQFENEFKVLKKLSHPNIAQIYDYGFDENLKKVFFTSPWLEGSDIFTHTQNLKFEDCEEIFIETLRAINYLHQKNLIHCDLKPGNIFVVKGKVVLIDFGLAGYFGEFIVGTPTYLAPEIFQGKPHTAQSDLYALGVIIYNCLTRTQPFSGKNLQEVYDRHRTLTPPSISEINKTTPKYFSDIVSTLLNKKPEERFQSAAAVIEEIDVFSKKNYPIETEETLLSYLPTQSELIGRKEMLVTVQKALSDFIHPETNKIYHLILLFGEPNVGKNKVVSKIINDLQLNKISVETAHPPLQDSDSEILLSSKAIVLEQLNSYLTSQREAKGLEKFIQVIEQKILSEDAGRFLLVLTSHQESDFERLTKFFPKEATQITKLELLPYTKDEMKEFLVSVLGHKEIPQTFLSQFYRNTDGLPGVATLLIQTMIEKGMLFDKSGRWNEDLLVNLESTFDKLEISESLEQEFERIFNTLKPQEEEAIKWLSLCPQGLSLKQLGALMPQEDLEALLIPLTESKIIRQENRHFSLSRTIFQNFVQENLPEKEVARRHKILGTTPMGLEKKWAIYHLSLSDDTELSLKATQKLAKIYEESGERDLAIECYQRLLKRNNTLTLDLRMGWILKMATLLIWTDRFQEACDLLTLTENEIQQKRSKIRFFDFLALLEKKGLALKHLQDFDKASVYFKNGLKYAQKDEDYKIHQIRFENDLAEMKFIKGDIDEAIEIFIKTRLETQQLNAKQILEITNNDLGHVFLQKQDYTKCLASLLEDVRTFSSLQNKEPLARALYSMAQALLALGQSHQAILAYQNCIQYCREYHLFSLLLRTYNGLGNLHFSKNDFEMALDNYQRAIELSVHLNDATSKSVLLFNQGLIYRKLKNHVLSHRRFLHAIQVLENKTTKTGYDNQFLSSCFEALTNLHVEDKNNMKALGYYLERIRLADKLELSIEEKNNYQLDLMELYLLNRLKEPFSKETHNVSPTTLTPEQKLRFDKMMADWNAIDAFDEQENTKSLSQKS